MELRVEAADGSSLPNGCFVGVRVGEVLKQGRYEPSRCYHFPQCERRRNAKIDVYQHVGYCVVAVDPGVKSNHEVAITTTDPNFPASRLKVFVQSKSEELTKQQRDDRTNALKNQAKEYLVKHNIEERLSEAVKALLKEQPEDPTEFLCRHLGGSGGELSPKLASTAPTTQAAPAAPQEAARQSVAAVPEHRSSVPVQAQATAAQASPAPSKPSLLAKQKTMSAAMMKAAKDGSLETILASAEEKVPAKEAAPAAPAPKPPAQAFVYVEAPPKYELPSSYMISNLTLLGPAYSSMGVGPSVLFI